jgi:hypothetical protein
VDQRPDGFKNTLPGWNVAPPIEPQFPLQQAPQSDTRDTAKNGVDYGDCFFEAALASLSATTIGAAAIEKMSAKNAVNANQGDVLGVTPGFPRRLSGG